MKTLKGTKLMQVRATFKEVMVNEIFALRSDDGSTLYEKLNAHEARPINVPHPITFVVTDTSPVLVHRLVIKSV